MDRERPHDHKVFGDEAREAGQGDRRQPRDEEDAGEHRRDALPSAIRSDESVASPAAQEPDRQEQGPRRHAVGHHVEDGAGHRRRAARKDAEHDEAEMADRRVGDQTHEVVGGDRHEGAPEYRDDGEHHDGCGRILRGLRNDPKAQGDHAVGSDFVEHAHEQRGRSRRGLFRCIGKPRVHREHGRFDGESDEEGDKDQHAVAAHRSGRRVKQQRMGAIAVRREGHDPDEHHEPAEKRIENEFDRRAGSALSPVTADEEVHRQDHELEKHVEEEDVASGEDPDHDRLKHEDPAYVPRDPVGLLILKISDRR